MSDDPASKEAFRWEVARGLLADLRHEWPGMGEMANEQRAKAAVQISTMMDEIEAWRQAVQKADRDIVQLRQQVEELRGECDEARQEACRWMAEAEGGTPEEHAQEQGWNCFKGKP